MYSKLFLNRPDKSDIRFFFIFNAILVHNYKLTTTRVYKDWKQQILPDVFQEELGITYMYKPMRVHQFISVVHINNGTYDSARLITLQTEIDLSRTLFITYIWRWNPTNRHALYL